VNYLRYSIKARLAQLNKKSKDLIMELEKRGIKIYAPDFSAAINGRLKTPKADLVCDIADQILREWERK
jgi:hypothetical protein